MKVLNRFLLAVALLAPVAGRAEIKVSGLEIYRDWSQWSSPLVGAFWASVVCGPQSDFMEFFESQAAAARRAREAGSERVTGFTPAQLTQIRAQIHADIAQSSGPRGDFWLQGAFLGRLAEDLRSPAYSAALPESLSSLATHCSIAAGLLKATQTQGLACASENGEPMELGRYVAACEALAPPRP